MNDGVGESAKKAETVAMEGNMRFGWLMKMSSLGLAVSMVPFQKALLNDSDGGRLLKDVSPKSHSERCAAQPPRNAFADPNHIILTHLLFQMDHVQALQNFVTESVSLREHYVA